MTPPTKAGRVSTHQLPTFLVVSRAKGIRSSHVHPAVESQFAGRNSSNSIAVRRCSLWRPGARSRDGGAVLVGDQAVHVRREQDEGDAERAHDDRNRSTPTPMANAIHITPTIAATRTVINPTVVRTGTTIPLGKWLPNPFAVGRRWDTQMATATIDMTVIPGTAVVLKVARWGGRSGEGIISRFQGSGGVAQRRVAIQGLRRRGPLQIGPRARPHDRASCSRS